MVQVRLAVRNPEKAKAKISGIPGPTRTPTPACSNARAVDSRGRGREDDNYSDKGILCRQRDMWSELDDVAVYRHYYSSVMDMWPGLDDVAMTFM